MTAEVESLLANQDKPASRETQVPWTVAVADARSVRPETKRRALNFIVFSIVRGKKLLPGLMKSRRERE